jgi:4,5-dihydroxyphthalate decarboxylase
VRPLFDLEIEGPRYFAKTKLYPINHTIVMRRALYEREPWTALNLFAAFNAAKSEEFERGSEFLRNYFLTGILGSEVQHALATDPMAYGVKSARPVLETIAQYVHEQGLARRRVGLEELFAPSTLDL